MAGAAVQKLMMELAKEQEVLMHIADMAIETYVAESTLLRVQKLMQRDGAEAHQDKLICSRCWYTIPPTVFGFPVKTHSMDSQRAMN